MFCPDCGTENVRGQKFCARCGSNLLAIDRAREVVSEFSGVPAAPQISPSAILKVVALISIFGMLTITGGTIFLMMIDRGNTPIPIFFGLGGLGAMVLICRHLLRLISAPMAAPPVPRSVAAPAYAAHPAAPVPRGATNRRLGEAAAPYQSIVEERTRQFEER